MEAWLSSSSWAASKSSKFAGTSHETACMAPASHALGELPRCPRDQRCHCRAGRSIPPHRPTHQCIIALDTDHDFGPESGHRWTPLLAEEPSECTLAVVQLVGALWFVRCPPAWHGWRCSVLTAHSLVAAGRGTSCTQTTQITGMMEQRSAAWPQHKRHPEGWLSSAPAPFRRPNSFSAFDSEVRCMLDWLDHMGRDPQRIDHRGAPNAAACRPIRTLHHYIDVQCGEHYAPCPGGGVDPAHSTATGDGDPTRRHPSGRAVTRPNPRYFEYQRGSPLCSNTAP